MSGASAERPTTARILAAAGVCLAVAIPHLWSGLFWYPAGVKDSLLYVFGASRFLTTGNLLRRALDPSAWTYSAYPFVLAVVSRLQSRHPMAAYNTLGEATVFFLPAAIGVFAHQLTGRFRPALAAYVIASLWGGLAAYLFFVFVGLPALIAGGALPMMPSDYYDPRFLGEYAGPHSELTAYLCQMPSYPRTAGLVVFWPALAVIYGGLPYPSVRRLLVFSALLALTVTIYPYYGVTGLVVLLVVGLLRIGRRAPERRGRFFWLALGTALGVLVLADFFVHSQTQTFHIPQYLAFLWSRPLKPDSWLPPLQFNPLRTLSGHFFMVGTVLWAAALPETGCLPKWEALAARIRTTRAWTGWPLFGTSLLVCLAGGFVSWLSVRGRMMLNAYGWIVPWRALVEPVVVWCTATSLERLLTRLAEARRRALVVAVVALPCLSPLHWAVNSAFLYRSHHRNRELYQSYLADGSRLLGRTPLREPLLLEGDVGETFYVEAAFGVRAVSKWDDAMTPLLEPTHREALLALMRQGTIGDLAVARQGDLARQLLASTSLEVVASFGRYDVLRAVETGP